MRLLSLRNNDVQVKKSPVLIEIWAEKFICNWTKAKKKSRTHDVTHILHAINGADISRRNDVSENRKTQKWKRIDFCKQNILIVIKWSLSLFHVFIAHHLANVSFLGMITETKIKCDSINLGLIEPAQTCYRKLRIALNQVEKQIQRPNGWPIRPLS